MLEIDNDIVVFEQIEPIDPPRYTRQLTSVQSQGRSMRSPSIAAKTGYS